MAGRALTVLQLVPRLDEGGVERGTLEVAEALVEAGHRALVISGGGRLAPALRARGAEHIEWPVGRKSPLTLRLVRPLARLVAAQGIDIVHARSRLPAWIATLALGRQRPARFVTTVHGLYSVNAYSAVMTRADRVIAVSETVRAYIERCYPDTDPAAVRVIPRGIDPRLWPPGHRPSAAWLERFHAEHPELRGKRLVVIAGRLTRLKGHRDFFAVIERLQAAGLPVHGVAVGDHGGRRAARLRRAAQGRPVTFTGHRSDLREIYAAASVALSLSARPESFGRAVLEPLALGVPVVGYDHGGVGEILAHLLPAGRVPPGDVLAAARRAAEFLRVPPAIASEHPFLLERMKAATLALYEELAEELGEELGRREVGRG